MANNVPVHNDWKRDIQLTKTKTIVMLLLIVIATVGTIGLATNIQSAQGQEVNPSTGNPHPPGEPTGNPHQSQTSGSGDPHGQSQGGFGRGFTCHGAQ